MPGSIRLVRSGDRGLKKGPSVVVWVGSSSSPHSGVGASGPALGFVAAAAAASGHHRRRAPAANTIGAASASLMKRRRSGSRTRSRIGASSRDQRYDAGGAMGHAPAKKRRRIPERGFRAAERGGQKALKPTGVQSDNASMVATPRQDPAASSGYRSLDQQRRIMSWLGGLLLTVMCLTLVLISWWQGPDGFNLRARWPSLVGLVGLVVIFVLYTQHKQRQLGELERRLRESAVREATLQARFSELAYLFDTSTQLQLRLDLAGMLELAAQRLIACLDATQSSIMLHRPETNLLEVRAAAGVDSTLVKGAKVKPGEGIAGHVFSSGVTLLLAPEIMAKRFPDEIKHGRTIASALCVPLRFRGNPIGVVSVARTSGEPLGDVHARMLETFAEHCAATVVKTEHHHDVLRQMKKVA